MTDLKSQIEKDIRDHMLDNLQRDDQWVMPFYDGLSLLNIPGTICQLLNIPGFGQQPMDARITAAIGGPFEKVIVLLVDAMGYDLFNRMKYPGRGLVWGKYADRAVYLPITSICPSTTASALTSLWTGQGPAAHGIIGYEMWVKEYGMVVNNILQTAASTRGDVGGLERAGFDPLEFLSTPTLGSHLRDHEISSTAYMHVSIANSGLSTMHLSDVCVRSYVNEADLCVSLANHLNSQPDIREYIYVYYSDVDTLIHRYAAEDVRIDLQFHAFSSLFEMAVLKMLTQEVAKETLLIMTADHGARSTPRRKQYDLTNHPQLMDCLVMQPTCENRMAFLYVRPGRLGAVKDYFYNTWTGQFTLLDPDQALENGLFGNEPHKSQTRERLGDLIAVATGDAYLWWALKPNRMLGRHGGLSWDEMLVPFYALHLGEVI